MQTLIKNCTLISMDEARPKIEQNQDVLIENDEIKAIGKNLDTKIANTKANSKANSKDKNFNTKNIDKIIDAHEKILMPGLINTHTHIAMSIFRETLDGYKLQDWLEKKIWPMEEKMTDDDVYHASLLSFIEMIKTGCTTANDMYFGLDSVIKAKEETGIRLQTTITMTTLAGEEDGLDRFNRLCYQIAKYRNHDKTLTFNMGIHGLYTSTYPYIKKCVEFAKNLGIHIHMHFCENEDEVKTIKKSYKKHPVDILVKDFDGIPLLLAHCVKLTKKDLDKIKKLDLSISTCPISNLKLGCGIPLVADMLDKNINICLGTDGQGSGSNLDLFEVMKFTALLQKGIKENPTLMDSYEILKMATINGAKALQLDDIIGSVTPGKKADLILLDLDTHTTKPTNNLFAQIVYNATGHHVDTTIINGQVLMKNKTLTIPIDQTKITKKCEDIIKRIAN